MNPTGTSDLAWCHGAVADVSRTFAITVDVLEEPMSDRICVGYLVCRIADTIEDAGHVPPAAKVDLLQSYRAVLAADGRAEVAAFREAADEWMPPEGRRSDDWEVVANSHQVIRAFESLPSASREAIRGPARELVGGMSTFVERYADIGGLRIRTVEELEEYCWYAAGTVGELVTNLLVTDANPAQARVMRENDRSFALLLQLVNVAKDVIPDYREENNVYLPGEWLYEAGITPSDIPDPDNASAVASVVDRVVDRAVGYLDGARAYLQAMPETQGNTLRAWAIPYLLAVGTIRELRARPEDVVVEGNVKVPREEVHALLRQFDRGVDRSDLEELATRIERKPLHRV